LLHPIENGHSEIPVVPGEEKYIEIGRKIKGYAAKGKKIPDELYVEIITQKLNMLFPPKKKEEFLEFYSNLPEQSLNPSPTSKGLGLEYNSMAPLTNEEIIMKKIMNHSNKYHEGWILLDFPHTYEQAKSLERHLSGFLTKDEMPLTEREKELELAALLTKSDPMKMVPRKVNIRIFYFLCFHSPIFS
jgi:adenylate kinase family enzyme